MNPTAKTFYAHLSKIKYQVVPEKEAEYVRKNHQLTNYINENVNELQYVILYK